MSLKRLLSLLLTLNRTARFSRLTLVLVILAGIASGGASAALVAIVHQSLGTLGKPIGQLAFAFAMLCIAFPLLRFLSNILLLKMSERAIVELRLELCGQILHAPLRKLESLGAPRLLATLIEDVDAIIAAYVNLPQLAMNLTLVLGVLAYMGWLSWPLLLVVLLILIVGSGFYQIAVLRAHRSFEAMRDAWDRLHHYLRGLLAGTKELKMHQGRRQSFVELCLRGTSEDLLRQSVRANTIYYSANSWGQALFFILIGCLLFVLPGLMGLSPEILTGYTLAVLYLIAPLDTIMHAVPSLGRAEVAIGRIRILGDELQEVSEKVAESEPPRQLAGPLELKGIAHAYESEDDDDRFVVGPVDLRLEPGELVFMTGGNGSGKTTLAKLLVGLYQPTVGEIRVAGQRVEPEDLDNYRQLFSVVFADYYLFERLLGLEHDDLDGTAAEYLQRLHLTHKVQVKDAELSTLNLSQGQRKRLALLTSYLEDRAIYLFDEWAADQDPEFKEVFYRRLLPELRERGKTVIVITHDDRYYGLTERLLKLEEGHIVYDGPPNPLNSEETEVQEKGILEPRVSSFESSTFEPVREPDSTDSQVATIQTLTTPAGSAAVRADRRLDATTSEEVVMPIQKSFFQRATWLFLTRLLPASILLGLIALILGFFWLRAGGHPVRTGSHTVAGLEASVSVQWNPWGVPHLEANSEADLMRALGYIHANDRMGQMELGRRRAFGRLAERLGPLAVESDLYFRSLRSQKIVEQLWRAMEPETRLWLEAYAAGVNAWLEERGGDLPPVLRLLGRPEPWTPEDSLAFIVLMADDLSFWRGVAEDERFLWLREFGPETVADLLDVENLHLDPEVAARAGETERLAKEGSGNPVLGAPGSNGWVVGPSRTDSGHAMVANDPHLGLGLPSIWYQVLVRSPSYEAAGMTLPGVPGVIIGRGTHAAWALTATMLDDHDVFFEILDEKGENYRRGDEWKPLEVERQTLRIRGAKDLNFKLRSTDLGPLLEADPYQGLPPRSLAWTLFDAGDPLAAFRRLARATNAEEALAGIENFVCPAQNLMVAFSDGEILQTVLGRVPERSLGDGRLPSPAWLPGYAWTGLRAAESNPRILNPTEDLLVNANGNPLPTDYELSFTADFFPDFRQRRIQEQLSARKDWTASRFQDLQGDIESIYARDLIAHLTPVSSPEARRAVEALRDWDARMELEGPSVLFALVERELIQRAFDDEVEAAAIWHFGDRDRLLRLMTGELDSSWFDDVSTPEAEERAATVDAALVAAWREGVVRWGEDVSQWRYGDLHRLVLRHPLDAFPGLGNWFRRGPFSVGGSATSVNALAGGWWEEEGMEVSYGPSMRWVFDWGNPQQALAVLPGGQSGHPDDPHYADQIEAFVAGQLLPAPWSRAEIEKFATSNMKLKP